MARGHDVEGYEPEEGWSAKNLATAEGAAALDGYRVVYPRLPVRVYDPQSVDLERLTDGADLVIVHEWNPPELVARIGELRRRSPGMRLLFHDTHHRSITEPAAMARYNLANYDGVLAFGESVRREYLKHGWANQVWAWHEAADTRVFHPIAAAEKTGELVWIGNWGDDERSAEIREFLIAPVGDLRLRARIYGVRYPEDAKRELEQAGIEYMGWLPNYLAPEVFAKHLVTVHVPRRPYAEQLRGIPTIRMFEALACGIPLVSAPWEDAEHLFPDGSYLKARTGDEMRERLQDVISDPELAQDLARRGRETIEARHTCAHRVDELLTIYGDIAPQEAEAAA
jgi:spore maturation protein CgeB